MAESKSACLTEISAALTTLAASGRIKPLDTEAAARLLNGAALNAALWVAASEDPANVLPRAAETFRIMARGLLAD